MFDVSATSRSRREFLQTTGKAGLAIGIQSAVAPCFAETADIKPQTQFGEQGLAVPDDGWRLWLDTQAAWKDDQIFLPDDVVLEKLSLARKT